MKNVVFVPVSVEVYNRIAANHADVTAAIESLAKPAAAPVEEKPAAPSSIVKGHQWKNVFLPNGTRLKMTYAGKTHLAKVAKGEIIYAGEAVSPSIFARRAANNTSRNAWRDIWVKLPKETEWKLADDLRRAAE